MVQTVGVSEKITATRETQFDDYLWQVVPTPKAEQLLECEIHDLHQIVTASGSHGSLQQGTKTRASCFIYFDASDTLA